MKYLVIILVLMGFALLPLIGGGRSDRASKNGGQGDSPYYPLSNRGTIEGVQYYRSGSRTPVQTQTRRGLVLAGGGSDVRQAFDWMVDLAGKGDFVVIRISGSDGYNDPQFIRGANSITTLIIDTREKADSDFVRQILLDADALFMAGGDQTAYYDTWAGTAVQQTMEFLYHQKGIPIGGTSAGMALLGGFVYAPTSGSAESSVVLRNPFHRNMQDIRPAFLTVPLLDGVLTDTHWSERDRFGRTLAMMARVMVDHDRDYSMIRGIAADEATSITIDENGQARVFGSSRHPDYAYFMVPNGPPEVVQPGEALHWPAGLTVYRVRGFENGRNSFDLVAWSGGEGVEVELVSVVQGVIDNDVQRSSK